MKRSQNNNSNNSDEIPKSAQENVINAPREFFSKGEDGADDTTATQQQKNGGILYVYIYMCVCVYYY